MPNRRSGDFSDQYVALKSFVTRNEGVLLWTVGGLLSAGLGLSAVVVVRKRVRAGVLGSSSKAPNDRQERHRDSLSTENAIQGVRSPMRVFFSYASEDRKRVAPLYDRLITEGFAPWMDSRDLLPGQKWPIEIEKALRNAEFVLLFVSPSSVDKRGFIPRKIKTALDQWQEKLPDESTLSQFAWKAATCPTS